MSIETVNEFLAELGQTVGLPELRLDEDGYCCLSFDALETHLQHDGDRDALVVFARLGALAEEVASEAYELLLSANLFWAGTNGATLSVEPADRLVYLAASTPLAGLEYPDFEAWLGGFVAAADRWTENVAKLNSGEEAAPTESPMPPARHFMPSFV